MGLHRVVRFVLYDPVAATTEESLAQADASEHFRTDDEARVVGKQKPPGKLSNLLGRERADARVHISH